MTFSKKTIAIIFLAVLFCFGQITAVALPSEKTLTARRNVTANPTKENGEIYAKLLLKEYKKANREKNYEEAADYLRAALYFQGANGGNAAYRETLLKLNAVLEKSGIDLSQSNRLEIAKNLLLENKIYAAAYEFSTLIKEGYETDVCYEYLGDISKKTDKQNAALAFYKKAVEINPENLNAKYKYANALLNAGKSSEAVYYFEDVIEAANSKAVIDDIIKTFSDRITKDPNDENNYGILGLAYQKNGQYDKTYRLLKKSLILNPNDIFLRYHLGNLLFDIKEYAFADEIYTEILNENPYESQIRISRAKAYAAAKQEQKAIKDYRIVLAMYPDSIQAQYGMYTLLKGKNSIDKIVSSFYPLEPDYKLGADGFNNLGYLANRKGNTGDAIVFFEKSLSINPKSETPYIELYKLYQLGGQSQKAKNILQAGYRELPKNQEILELYTAANSDKVDEKNNIALSYLNEGEYKKAIAAYQLIEPKNAGTFEAIANCYRQLGDLKNAISNYKKALEINPENSETYYALGVTYIEANDIKKAKDAFLKSVQKDGKNIKSKKMLSYIEQKEIIKSLDLAYDFFEQKSYTKALYYLDEAVKTFPDDPKVYYYRALTRNELKDYKGAVSDFKKTIEIDRNYIVAYYKLGEALEKINKKKEALFMYEKYLGAENIDRELAKAAQQRVLELGERYY